MLNIEYACIQMLNTTTPFKHNSNQLAKSTKKTSYIYTGIQKFSQQQSRRLGNAIKV